MFQELLIYKQNLGKSTNLSSCRKLYIKSFYLCNTTFIGFFLNIEFHDRELSFISSNAHPLYVTSNILLSYVLLTEIDSVFKVSLHIKLQDKGFCNIRVN